MIESNQVIKPSIIAGVSDVNDFLPTISEKTNIKRDNLLGAIEEILNEKIDLVFIEGQPGIGKSNLLAQFAKNNDQTTISIFLDSTTVNSFSTNIYLESLCRQIQFILNIDPKELPNIVSIQYYNQLLAKLSSNRKGINYFYIIDGINNILDKYIRLQLLEEIFRWLPINQIGYKIIITGDNSLFKDVIPKDKKYSAYRVAGFSANETKDFIDRKEISLDIDTINKIHRISKGNPSSIECLLRIRKKSDLAFQELINSSINNKTLLFEDFLEDEWAIVENNIKKEANSINDKFLLLAIVFFSKQLFSIEEIADISQLSEDFIFNFLNNISIINIGSNRVPSLLNSSIQRVGEKKLLAYESEALGRIIIFVENNKKQERKKMLPEYYLESGKLQNLLQYIDKLENIKEMVVSDNTLILLQRRNQMVLESFKSSNINTDNSALRLNFNFRQAIIESFKKNNIMRSEIVALIALGKYHTSIGLALSAMSREDKFEKLLHIARKMKEKKENIDPYIIELIESLYVQLDFSLFNEESVENISEDLLTVSPKKVTDFIEQSSATEAGENSTDWNYFKLIMKAKINGDKKDNEFIEDIQTRIKDTDLKAYAKIKKSTYEEYDSEKLKSELDGLDTTSAKFLLIEPWLELNAEKEDAIEISKYAFDLIIKTTDYKANAGKYNLISSPLEYCKDSEAVERLVNKFHYHLETIKNIGPYDEYLALRLSLAAAKGKTDKDYLEQSLEDIYYSIPIDKEKDSLVQMSCYARLLLFMQKIQDYNDHLGIAIASKEKVRNLFDILLTQISEHELIINPLIDILASENIHLILEFIPKLNLEERRDNAYNLLLHKYLKNGIRNVNIETINLILNSIQEIDNKDTAILFCIHSLDESKEPKTESEINKYKEIITKIHQIEDTLDRCRAYTLAYLFIEQNFKESKYFDFNAMYQDLLYCWDNMENKTQSIEEGYKIVEAISNVNLNLANDFMIKVEEKKQTIQFHSIEILNSYILSVKLIIRLLSGLIEKKIYPEDYLITLERSIINIPSKVQQMRLWRTIALNFYLHKDIQEFNKIVETYILKEINEDDSYLNKSLVQIASLCIYLYKKEIFFKMIDKNIFRNRDNAIGVVCDFLSNGELPDEPYDDSSEKNRKLEYIDITQIIELLPYIRRDSKLYFIIKQVSDSICYYKEDLKNGRTSYKREQLPEIINNFSEIFKRQLPDLTNIRHPGYVIIAKSELLRIKEINDRHSVKDNDWTELIDSANKNINNDADKSFVLSILYKNAKNKNFTKSLIESSLNIAQNIPANANKVSRMLFALEQIHTQDRGLLVENIRKINDLIRSDDKSNFRSLQKELIDLAYKTDTKLAESLAVLYDDDPANSKNLNQRIKREVIKRKLEREDFKKKFNDREYSLIPKKYLKEIPDLYWSRLKKLNSNPETVKEKDAVDEILGIFPYLHKPNVVTLYPIFSWFIQNLNKRTDYTTAAANINNYFQGLVTLPKIISIINQSIFLERDLDVINSGTSNKIPISLKSISIRKYYDIFNFNIDNLEKSKWIILTGENSFGKSSVLRAIVIGLLGLFQAKNEEDNKDLKSTEVTVTLSVNNQEIKYINGISNHKKFRKIATYGPVRLNAQNRSEPKTESSVAYNLFNTTGFLLDIEDALLGWKKLNEDKFRNVVSVLISVLSPYIADIIVSKDENDKEIIKYYEGNYQKNNKQPTKPLTFYQLASGVKSILLMIGDMMIRLFDEQQTANAPSDLQGIVIIDEFDLHLHPKWQRELPIQLDKAFPNIQFIVSTHSPIPFLGVPKETTFVKINKNENNEIIPEILDIDVSVLSPNSILTSPIFGFQDLTPISHDGINAIFAGDDFNKKSANEKIEKEFEDILSKDKLNEFIKILNR